MRTAVPQIGSSRSAYIVAYIKRPVTVSDERSPLAKEPSFYAVRRAAYALEIVAVVRVAAHSLPL